MKFYLSSFVFFLNLISFSVLAEEINKTYIVKMGGIRIGELNWSIKMDNEVYLNELNLTSKGVLSAIYSFKGEYLSRGIIYNKKLVPKKYKHFWQTKKITKKMELIFNEDRLTSLEQEPVEQEKIRLNIFNIQKPNDPLTSFLQIMMGDKKSLVVDGRRLYTMEAAPNENQITVEISNYSNLWADHKRNKFEKIIFEKSSVDFLPTKIFIYFDGRVFRLVEN